MQFQFCLQISQKRFKCVEFSTSARVHAPLTVIGNNSISTREVGGGGGGNLPVQSKIEHEGQ